ncbi:MAG: aminopeptidase P family protein [Acidobacteriia bacterium]|nr:aminopeptidase P family protein [Terriglobia bacterium]
MSNKQAAGPSAEIYRERRNKMREAVGGGVILWLGHMMQPRNYTDNAYPFRQNSHFLYYTGLAEPDLAVLSYPDRDYDVLFSRPTTMDDIIWSGASQERMNMARQAGIETLEDIGRLGVYLTKAQSQRLTVHYLPPYQASSLFRIAELLVIEPTDVTAGVSQRLKEEVARQRNVKTDLEIREIEDALRVTDHMHRRAMAVARPGIYEYEVAGEIQAVALRSDFQMAFPPIVTVRGQVLHNHSYGNILQDGQLMINDSGAESPNGYAADITRTFPVGGRFSPAQKDIYETVLSMQLGAIEAIKPGIRYRDVHLQACRILAERMISLGLMKGNPSSAVEAGAHALFFPHGLGHMMGLDVHDMEDLGDIVGYPKGEARSSQFGLNFLRMSRPLEEGFVLTVEPGIYFIPALIDRWAEEKQHKDFIVYDKLGAFRAFGGCRIEDDVLVTGTGARVLGPGIPKTIGEVEAAMGRK